jgi:hypothetical protein
MDVGNGRTERLGNTVPRKCSMQVETRMTKSHPQDETTRALVKRFCDHIFWLKRIHYTFRELYEDDGSKFLMERTALAFFQDLNRILDEYFLLEVAKLTDSATSLGGKCENFTVANLIETVEWPSECIQEIKKLNEAIQSFRKYIEPARHKLLAHYDKQTVLSGDTLGVFPAGEDRKLLEVLEQICNVSYKAAFGKILGDMVPYHDGDVLDFKKALSKAIAFDKLLSDSKGDDLGRLSRILIDVESSQA